MKISFINRLLSKGDVRSKTARKNITVAFVCKGVSILLSFFIVPITLTYVTPSEYGIWMIISSIINWFGYFDVGLDRGLRNKFTESLANNNKKLAKIYVSSAFFLICIIAVILFLVFLFSAQFIPWNAVLNTMEISNLELKNIIVVVFFFFCIQFVLKIFSSVLNGLQKYSINYILALISQILGLAVIYVLSETTNGSLFLLCMVYGGKTAVVMSVATVILFRTTLKEYKPALKDVQLRKSLPLITLGARFFANQILIIIVTQSSVILIAQFFGPKDVTVYNLANKYMSVPTMLYIMVLEPHLAAFTEAYTKGDYHWIKKTINNLNYISVGAIFLCILLIVFHEPLFALWTKGQVVVPLYLLIAFALFVITRLYTSTYSLFLNSIGKINIQFVLLAFQGLLFIPLSIAAYKMGFELISILIVQIIFQIASIFLLYVQYNKIMSRTATGVWNK